VVESPPAYDAIVTPEDLAGRFENRALMQGGRMKTSIRRFEIERFSVTSSVPFEAVVAALKDAVGRLDLVEFAKVSKQAGTFAELKEVVDRNLGKTGLMLFMELDHGAVLRKETGLTTPKIVRLVIGNPLVMKEMANHVPEAGSYAPVTVLVDEQGDGVHLSYDRMASLLAPYGNMEASAVARDLDSKIENLLLLDSSARSEMDQMGNDKGQETGGSGRANYNVTNALGHEKPAMPETRSSKRGD